MSQRYSFTIAWNAHQRRVLQRMIRFHELACNTSAETVRAIDQLEREIADGKRPQIQQAAILARQALVALGHEKLLDRREAKDSAYRTSLGVWSDDDGKALTISQSGISHSLGVDGTIAMIQMAMRVLDIEEPVRLEWPVDKGGAAALVTRADVRRMTTHDWLEAEAAGIALRTQMGQDIEPGDRIWGDIGWLCEIVGTFEDSDRGIELREFMDLEDMARRGGRNADEMRNLSKDRLWTVVKAIAEHALDQPNEGSTEHPTHQSIRTGMMERVRDFADARIAAPSSELKVG